MAQIIIDSVLICGCCVWFLSHAVGIVMLMKKKNLLNTYVFIMNLSIVNLFYSALTGTAFVMRPILTTQEDILKFHYSLTIVIVVAFYTCMILVAIDRFLPIFLHLKYKGSSFERNRINIAKLVWVAFAILLVVMSIFQNYLSTNVLELVLTVLGYIGSVSTNMTFFSVYIYIYVKYRRATVHTKQTIYGRQKRKIFAPFIILFTYFLFITIPHVLNFTGIDIGIRLLIFSAAICLNGIADSLVYIIINKPLRISPS